MIHIPLPARGMILFIPVIYPTKLTDNHHIRTVIYETWMLD